MATTVAIEVEAAVEVSARIAPEGMSATAMEAARGRKIQDVLIVLERDQGELEAVLAQRARPLVVNDAAMAPGAERPEVAVELAFPDKGHGFTARLMLKGPEGRAMGRQVRSQFAGVVRDEIRAHITRRATSAGAWDVTIAAEPKHAARRTVDGGSGYAGVWLSLLALFAAAAGGAYYFLTPH